MNDIMMFPKTVEEFMEQYKIVDREQVYTNGMELVPIFRMKQWFEHQKNARVEKKPRYIDANALLAKLNQEKIPYDSDINYFICHAPTADVVEVVHGEWIYNKISQLWECSACHEEEIRTTTYCPHCGADMRGGKS